MAIVRGTDASDPELEGTNVADQIFGYGGNDILIGFDSDDILEGGAGADQLFGSTGFDYASYRGSSSAVFVDAQGGVWVGSDMGVGRFDPARESWLVLREGNSPAPHLVSDTVRCITGTRTLIDGDPHDVVWVGTDAGISRIDSTLATLRLASSRVF